MRRSGLARLGFGLLGAVVLVPVLGCVAAPAPVIGLATAGDAQATVSWSPPLGDTAAGVQSYVVTPYVGSTPQPPSTVGAGETSAVITGLTNGTTYSFSVRATIPSGDTATSQRSNPVTPLDAGLAYSWGDNWAGQLGNGSTGSSQASPAQIGAGEDWAVLDAGYSHAVALKTDGSLWAWGGNFSGQLGDGTTTNRATPTQIGVDTDWARVEAGSSHTLAVKDDGTLWAWGDNQFGQIGDGTTVDRLIPTQIGSATSWSAITASNDGTAGHSLAIKTDGTLWAWGSNMFGELGDGTTADRVTPVRIGTATNWTSVAAGGAHSVALRADGTLWTWGWNLPGLPQWEGDPPPTMPPPAQIGTATDWATGAAGLNGYGSSTAAIKTDGSLRVWSAGYADTYPGDWVAVNLGWSGIVGLQADGSIWTWNYHHFPTRVGTGDQWVAISAGEDFTLALQDP
jgi:alpha-tubulin suppressor-like RCC1 family protein